MKLLFGTSFLLLATSAFANSSQVSPYESQLSKAQTTIVLSSQSCEIERKAAANNLPQSEVKLICDHTEGRVIVAENSGLNLVQGVTQVTLYSSVLGSLGFTLDASSAGVSNTPDYFYHTNHFVKKQASTQQRRSTVPQSRAIEAKKMRELKEQKKAREGSR